MTPTREPAADTPRRTSTGPRRRAYQLGAALVSGLAVVAVVVAVLTSGSTSQLAPGKPVPGAGQSLALFAGIPQHGIALGSPKAPVTLVELGDLQCPICAGFATGALPTIVSRYVREGRVRIEFRGLHIIGGDSLRAAQMAAAVGEQNRLWQLIDLMYRNQGAENTGYVTDRYLAALAGAIPGVHVGLALRERNSAAVRSQLAQATALAAHWHIAATPSFLISAPGEARHVFIPADPTSSTPFSEAFEHALSAPAARS
jgi:protein-disulfide isomerase